MVTQNNNSTTKSETQTNLEKLVDLRAGDTTGVQATRPQRLYKEVGIKYIAFCIKA